jgi:hypothetical protein
MTVTPVPPPNVDITQSKTGRVTVPWYDFFRSAEREINRAQVTNYSVKDFGAKGNGVTDDTVAVRAAVQAMRDGITQAYSTLNHATYPWLGVSPGYLYFPPGIYKITGSINLQDIQAEASVNEANAQGWGIVGDGATILATSVGGGAVFDCLGASDGLFRGFAIMGDPAAPPTCGVLVGRINFDNVPAGSHLFERVFFSGVFTNSAIFNASGEGNCYLRVSIHNQSTLADAYGIVSDGYHHLTVPTTYTNNVTANQTGSNIQHTFVSCDVMMDVGVPYYFSNANQVHLVGGNYATVNTTGNSAIRFEQGGAANGFQDLQFNMNVEGAPKAFLEVRQASTTATMLLNDVRIHDHGGQETGAIIKSTGFTNVSVVGADIYHASTASVSTGNVTFDHLQVNGRRKNDWDYGAVLANDASTFFDVTGSALQTPVCTIIASSNTSGLANLASTTGELTGTSGTTPNLTVSASSLGRIYVENRTGGSLAVALKAMSV